MMYFVIYSKNPFTIIKKGKKNLKDLYKYIKDTDYCLFSAKTEEEVNLYLKKFLETGEHLFD